MGTNSIAYTTGVPFASADVRLCTVSNTAMPFASADRGGLLGTYTTYGVTVASADQRPCTVFGNTVFLLWFWVVALRSGFAGPLRPRRQGPVSGAKMGDPHCAAASRGESSPGSRMPPKAADVPVGVPQSVRPAPGGATGRGQGTDPMDRGLALAVTCCRWAGFCARRCRAKKSSISRQLSGLVYARPQCLRRRQTSSTPVGWWRVATSSGQRFPRIFVWVT
jgi:hypothetical protein